MPSKEKSQDFSLIPVTHKRKNCHLKENSNHQLGSMRNKAEEVKLIKIGNLDGQRLRDRITGKTHTSGITAHSQHKEFL